MICPGIIDDQILGDLGRIDWAHDYQLRKRVLIHYRHASPNLIEFTGDHLRFPGLLAQIEKTLAALC